MNNIHRASELVRRVRSRLLLPALLAAACGQNSMADDRMEPASDPGTATMARIDAEDQTSNGSRELSVWPAGGIGPHDIEFFCSYNPYLKGQFDLTIADDFRDNSGIGECNPIPWERMKDVKSVFWIVVPTLAKTLRDADYIYEGQKEDEAPKELVRLDVRSRAIIQIKVLAFDPRDGTCAEGTFETTTPETRFSMPVVNTIAGDGSDEALRHPMEAASVQLHLTDIHEGASSTLTAHDEDICDNQFQNLEYPKWKHNFYALLPLWTATPIITEESIVGVGSPIPEMESVVRIQVNYESTSGTKSEFGSGFYIEDTRYGSGKRGESSLVLTNYHIVKHARHGAVEVSTLRYDLAHHAWKRGDAWMRGGEKRGEEERIQDYFPGRVIFYDEHRDLALVRVLYGGPPLELYQETPMPPGIHEVMALGHPLGQDFYATKGIVSSVILDCMGRFELPLKCIGHDAATNKGSSGGPLLFLRHGRGTHVLGVNAGLQGRTFLTVYGKEPKKLGEIELPFPGRSFAIHYEEVRGFLDEFMKFRSSD